MSSPFDVVVQALTRLPGFGRRSGERAALALAQDPERLAVPLIAALEQLRTEICLCTTCGAFTTKARNPCPLCSAPDRDRSVICVVEEPLDVLALERTGGFHGRYHVLQGVLSPIEGIGPDDLTVRDLVERVKAGEASEIILATNPSMEGDATALYLRQQLIPLGVRVTRLARGLPVGGDLEYADQNTLLRALAGRQEMT